MRPVLHAVIAAIGLATALPGCLKPPSELPELPYEGPPAPPSTAGEVLARYVSAAGGAEQLHAIKTRAIKADMLFHAQEDCDPSVTRCLDKEQHGSFHLVSTADGKLYRETTLNDVIGKMGFDGTTGWELRRGDPPPAPPEGPTPEGPLQLLILSEVEGRAAREDAILHWYFDLDERGIQVTLERTRKEDSRGEVMTLDGIRWHATGSGAPAKTMWFDRATGLLHEEIIEDGEGDQASKQLLVYTDYRDVDGAMVPYSIEVTTQVGEQVQVLDIVTQSVNHDPPDAEAFKIPEIPPPARVPDGLLTAVAAAKTAAEADPKSVLAATEYMRMAFAAADFDEAAGAADTVLKMNPKEPEALLIRARIHLINDDAKATLKALARAKAAGVKDEVLAREEAWLHYRGGSYGKLASALDRAKMPVLAGRFRSFVGKPLQVKAAAECVTTLPMVSTDPLVTVGLSVQGTKLTAIADTGAGHLILSESLANELGVSIRPLGAGSGGPIMGHGQVKTVELGGITLANVPVEIFGDEAMARNAGDVGDGVRAAFGLGMLTDFMVNIDAPSKNLELISGRRECASALAARRKGPSVPFWRAEFNYLYAKAELQDAVGVYLLNTGIRGADMAATSDAYAYAGIGAPPIRSDQAASVAVDKITIGPGFEARDMIGAYGFFEQRQTNDGYRLDGMLGLGVLGQHAIVFDFAKRRLYFPSAAEK